MQLTERAYSVVRILLLKSIYVIRDWRFQILNLLQTPPSRSAVVASSNLGGTKFESRLEPELDDDDLDDDDDEGGFDPWAITVQPTR